ncbi:MAG: hypothetical protein SPI77_05100 [Corynebacterium sp.]|nr:hypothetical protein [Corynebacterium sp.]
MALKFRNQEWFDLDFGTDADTAGDNGASETGTNTRYSVRVRLPHFSTQSALILITGSTDPLDPHDLDATMGWVIAIDTNAGDLIHDRAHLSRLPLFLHRCGILPDRIILADVTDTTKSALSLIAELFPQATVVQADRLTPFSTPAICQILSHLDSVTAGGGDPDVFIEAAQTGLENLPLAGFLNSVAGTSDVSRISELDAHLSDFGTLHVALTLMRQEVPTGKVLGTKPRLTVTRHDGTDFSSRYWLEPGTTDRSDWLAINSPDPHTSVEMWSFSEGLALYWLDPGIYELTFDDRLGQDISIHTTDSIDSTVEFFGRSFHLFTSPTGLSLAVNDVPDSTSCPALPDATFIDAEGQWLSARDYILRSTTLELDAMDVPSTQLIAVDESFFDTFTPDDLLEVLTECYPDPTTAPTVVLPLHQPPEATAPITAAGAAISTAGFTVTSIPVPGALGDASFATEPLPTISPLPARLGLIHALLIPPGA